MNIHKFDDFLSFELSEEYYIFRETYDGIETIEIDFGKIETEQGEGKFDFNIGFMATDSTEINDMSDDPTAYRLFGRVPCTIKFSKTVRSVSGEELIMASMLGVFKYENKAYEINTFITGNEEKITAWLQFINNVFASIRIVGLNANFSTITQDMLSEEEPEEDDGIFVKGGTYEVEMAYPVATPAEDQHSHWDFLENTRRCLGMLGGLVNVNQNGTEYSFEALDDYFFERFDSEDFSKAVAEATGDFELAELAREMGEIFRVNKDVFDDTDDREQEIQNGYVRRCAMYEAFRSFAWTLGAYCDKQGITPEQVPINIIEEIANFVVEDRDRLNYKADSFCSTLCSGDDIHNYYIPEGTPESVVNAISELLEENDEEENDDFDPKTRILSLEGLRRDMEFLFPAMQAIYDSLAQGRDFDELLEGPTAEVLYVWCSMTYAIRNAIYTEDGPMTCFWDYPGELPVLKSFGKVVKCEEEVVDCGYSFTYEQGNKFENENYTFYIPDGFVIQEGAEDRDFIAYLPSSEDSEDYLFSDFIIFAGNDMDGSINQQLKLPMTYHSVLGGFATKMSNTDAWFYSNRALPGVIAVSVDDGCLHANAIVAFASTLKMMRLQIITSSKKQGFACEALVKSVLDKMVPKVPVNILDEIDDAKYVDMSFTEEAVSQWCWLLREYNEQLVISRNQKQEGLVQDLKENNPGPAKIKKAIKGMLRYFSTAAAGYLKKADAIYQLKRIQDEGSTFLDIIKNVIDESLLDVVTQTVNLDEEPIVVEDAYRALYEAHMNMTPRDAIKDILDTCGDELSASLVEALKKYN